MPVTLASFAAGLIACLEGIKLSAYRDSGGIWTIGLGRTKDVHPGMTTTIAQATEWFAEDSAPLLALVADRPILEGAALVDFGYNVGPNALRRVLAGEDTIGNPIHQTDRHGQKLSGLVARRNLELQLIELSKQSS